MNNKKHESLTYLHIFFDISWFSKIIIIPLGLIQQVGMINKIKLAIINDGQNGLFLVLMNSNAIV